MKNGSFKRKAKNLWNLCGCLLLCATVLAGCKKLDPSSTMLPGDENQSSSILIEEENSLSVTRDEKENHSFGILKRKESVGEDTSLYYISNEVIESEFLQTMELFQDDLLIHGYWSEEMDANQELVEFYLKLISGDTGEVLAETRYDDLEFPNVQVCEKVIAVTDCATGKIFLLDEKLQEVSTHQVKSEYNSMHLSADGEKVYVFLPDEGLQVTELASGQTDTMLSQAANLYVSQVCGGYITFSYVDKHTQFEEYGALNLENGELVEGPFGGSYYYLNYAGDLWMASRFEKQEVNYIGNADNVKMFETPVDASITMIHSNPKHLLASYYAENGLAKMVIWDVEGNYCSAYENIPEGEFLQGKLLWSEADGGYFFLMAEPNGHDKLMFWDLSEELSGENLLLREVVPEVLSETEVSSELYERAKKISANYGIEIRIAEQMDEDYNDYKIEKMFDDYEISLALDAIERAFSKYPEGYFSQLLYGSIREIELHLAGELTNLEIPEEEVNGFTSFAGFVQTRNDKAVIVVDTWQNVNLEEHLHHELFHLTEDKLSFDAGIREDAVYSEERWMELNPEGFEYAYNLFELPEESFNDDYDEWFVELYSRTYPKEDRATIMEYAMLGMDAIFVAAPHRQAKLAYLCECIRDAFDTEGWPEETRWEKTLSESYEF